ncbi:FAD binding domain-containing protein [Nannizzia gypsea CBS 118893]|uniref:FAD binding domain-containing protein n=1 Tax=Arthroderma gypseum (strain ATCC MYA-4604 / CBS 118893) TaxID=535722 RepID=E4V4I4_ARTGP|nr:FAD binding domain-containing protein [Nannizzia gypsea CBS 118893]EFR04908.1 FAD binding domain-containing protein [Nannizzia gypsea CBS 118893]
MQGLLKGIVFALAAWANGSAARSIQQQPSASNGASVNICPRDMDTSWVDAIKTELVPKLSPEAKVYLPGSRDFDNASVRWSALDKPMVSVAIEVTVAQDVVETVKFANNKNVPFLAFNSAHGALTTLGKMDSGIEIFMKQLNSVEIAQDGKSVKAGGGINSKYLADKLWDANKQAVTGTCECVSYLGPALGGGHGWLQGHHGLIADQFLSMDVVLADGTLKTITPSTDLFWAMKGAGHNFGIVTSVTLKIYDIEHTNWAIETLTFSGDKVAAVYTAANNLVKNQPEGVIQWSYWLNNPSADANNPVIIVYLIQEGVSTVDSAITNPFHDINPISAVPDSGTYKDLGRWTGIALDSPPCQKTGASNPRFPIYLQSFNVSAMKQAYTLYAAETNIAGPFHNSIFMFEGYSTQGVKAVDAASTAYAFRGDNHLAAPLISYDSTGSDLDNKAVALGQKLRDILLKGSGRSELHTYVNYAFGSETPQQWYGYEQWRQDKLKALKQKYDPNGKFSFYAPVA